MNWKRKLIEAMTRKKYKAFIQDTLYPEHARVRLWQDEILPLLQQSAYWQAVLKEQGTELNDFSITSYATYRDELAAAQHSETQPFNGEKIIFWSETSGTTSVDRKLFPITQSFQNQFQRTMPPFIYNMTQRFPNFFKEKLVYLVAVDSGKTTPAGTPLGWISNYNYRNLPSLVKNFYALPDAVFADTEAYNQWAPLYALASDLNAFFAVTPMVIEMFYQRCLENFPRYLPYLLGEKTIPEPFPPLKISKKRQRYLRSLAKKSDYTFKELWPTLLFVGCWISGLCEYPAQQLKKLLGDDVALIDGAYSATEGWMTVPLDDKPGGFLHPGAHIVEFIEEGKDFLKENIVQSWELKQGKNYEVFLTTAMGFVRYQLNDVVKCVGFLNKAPRLTFCYKAQQLQLENCIVSGQDLQQMMTEVTFNMEAHWYFARNSHGNKIVLVTDDTVDISDSMLMQMDERLSQISPPYAEGMASQDILPMALLQVPAAELLADHHAQKKPKLISNQVITER
ncbi:GH3 auxin-responsive promoter family protein [Legionella sp.]|uniref:GH3 family domain-containing protein n=1 Tax=Legionella sp. TaxID=459 RepID=UPI00325AE4AE